MYETIQHEIQYKWKKNDMKCNIRYDNYCFTHDSYQRPKVLIKLRGDR